MAVPPTCTLVEAERAVSAAGILYTKLRSRVDDNTTLDTVLFPARRSGSLYSGICHRIRVGRTGGHIFWSQQSNSKTVRDRPYVQMGS